MDSVFPDGGKTVKRDATPSLRQSLLVGGLGLLAFAGPLTVNAFGSTFRAAFHVLALGLGVVALADLRSAGRASTEARRVVGILLVIWIYLVARAPASPDRHAALTQVLDRTALLVIVAILALGMIGQRRQAVIVAGLAGMVIVAGWGIAQRFGIHPFLDASLWEPSRPTRPLGTHNLMGAYTAAWLPVAAGAAVETQGIRRAMLGVALLLGLACFLLSESRGAWLAALGSGALMLPWLVHGGARRIAAAAKRNPSGLRLLAVAAFGVVLICMGTIASRLTKAERSGVLPSMSQGVEGGGASALTSLERRSLIARTALDLIADHPLWGSGPGSFRLAFYTARPPAMQQLEAQTGETAVRAHSDPLELAVELGLIGFGLVAIAVVQVGRIAWRTLKPEAKGLARDAERTSAPPRPPLPALADVGLIAGGLALGLHSLIDFSGQEVPTALTGAAFVGLVVGRGEWTGGDLGKSRRPGRFRAWMPGMRVVAAMILISGMVAAVCTEMAERNHRRAYAVLGAGDVDGSEAALRRSLALGPDRARDWVALGEVARHRARLAERSDERQDALVAAAARFETAARIEPQIAARWIRLAAVQDEARAAGAQIAPESTALVLERARNLNPYSTEAHVRLAALSRRSGDFDRAERTLEVAAERIPGDFRITAERGRLAWARRNPRQAIAAFTAAAEGNATLAGPFDGLAELARAGDRGMATEARNALMRFTAGSGRAAMEAARRLGDLALAEGDHNAARKWYDFAVARGGLSGGANPELELGLGDLALEEKDFTAAERHYNAALAMRTDMARALKGLGHLAVVQGDTALAERLYARALVFEPELPALRPMPE